MKKLTTIVFLVILAAVSALAQNGKAEQEILSIAKSLDEAFMKKDIAPFERVFADDYVYSTTNGKMMNRAQALEDLRREWANQDYKLLNNTTEGLKVKVSGNMALLTGTWTTTAAPVGDASAEPHTDTGRFTAVYEKRGGKWLLLTDHWTEAPHDRKLMEQQVLKAGQEYTRLIKMQDAAAVERLLADEYLFTNIDGKTRNKTEDLARYKTEPAKFEIFEISDQKARVIGNGAAVETGTVRFKGTDKNNKPIEGSERYTTTWVWRGGRWQIVADHVSEVRKQ